VLPLKRRRLKAVTAVGEPAASPQELRASRPLRIATLANPRGRSPARQRVRGTPPPPGSRPSPDSEQYARALGKRRLLPAGAFLPASPDSTGSGRVPGWRGQRSVSLPVPHTGDAVTSSPCAHIVAHA